MAVDESTDGEPETIEAECPECGESEHVVLRMADAGWTLQCMVCRKVRTAPAPPRERFRTVPAVLAQGAESRTIELQAPLDGHVAIDDEFDWEGHRVRITAVEKPDGTRPSQARGRDIRILYAVLFDTVTLRYTVNQGDITRAFQEEVSPELQLHIGTVRNVQGHNLAIKTLKSDQNRTLHRGFLLARNINRVFADLAPEGSRPGDPVKTRSRGAGPWGSQSAISRVKRPKGSNPGNR